MNPYYKDFSDFIKKQFPDEKKLQKLTLDIGVTCPNRDGNISSCGCIYCNNASFSPLVADNVIRGKKIITPTALNLSLEQSRQFFSKKYPDLNYLAYFQSYTNTYGDHDSLIRLYYAALSHDYIKGLIIATRPDCLDQKLLDRLFDISRNKKIIFELGAETSHDLTLKEINRGHTWSQTVEAVTLLKSYGFAVGLHFIFGLPGEDEFMMLQTVDQINRLPVDVVKFHHLQVIKGTELARRYLANRNYLTLFDVESYIDLCVKVINRLDKNIAIERFVSSAPADLLIAPAWGLKNYQFINLLNNRLKYSNL